DNARDSLLAAQRSDASYQALPAAVADFNDASAEAAARNIRQGVHGQAAALVAAAGKVAQATGQAGGPAIDRMQRTVAKALAARIDAAARSFDHAGALRTVEYARGLGLSRARID